MTSDVTYALLSKEELEAYFGNSDAELPEHWLDKDHMVFLVTTADEYIGLFAFWTFDKIAEIRQLLVTEEQQGKGYSEKLVTFMESEAKKRDVETLYVHDEERDFWIKQGYAYDDNAPSFLIHLPDTGDKKVKRFLSKKV